MINLHPAISDALLNQLPIGITILELISREEMNFRLVYANDVISKLSGNDIQQSIGKSTREAFPHYYEGTAIFPNSMMKALENQEKVYLGLETYIDDKQNTQAYDVSCIFLGENRIAFLTQSAEDIMSLNSQLSLHQQLLEKGEQTSKMSTWILDPASGELQFTPSYLDLHGFEPGDINPQNALQRKFSEVHEEDFESLDTFRYRDFSELPVSIDYRFWKKGKHLCWFRNTVAQKLSNGKLIGITQDITVEKEAEARLRNNNLELESVNKELQGVLLFQQKMMHTSPDLIYVYDLQERKNVFANRLLEDDLGYTREELHQMGDQFLTQIIHPDDLTKVFHHHDEILPKLKDGEVVKLEYRVKHGRSGEYVWMESTESLFERDETGANRKILGIARNIVDIKDFQLQLESLNKELQDALHFRGKVMNTTPSVIFIYNLEEHRAIYTNKSVTELLGYSEEEVRQMKDQILSRIVHPDDFEKVQHHYSHSLPRMKKDETLTLVRRSIRKDGKVIWLSSRKAVFEWDDENNKARSIIGILDDITDQKEAEASLEEANIRLGTVNLELQEALHFQERVMETSPNIIFIFDLEKQETTFINKVLTELLGYTKEEIDNMDGHSRAQLIHPEDLPGTIDHYQNVLPQLKLGETVDLVRRNIRKDGMTVWLNTRHAVFEWDDKNNKPLSIIGIINDITEQKEAEAEMMASNRELEQFVYSVSHDLRAPVRHIDAFTHLVKQEESDNLTSRGQEHLNKVQRSARRLGEMIDELLLYSRNRNATPQKTLIDMKELMLNLKEAFTQSSYPHPVVWEIQSLPDCVADRKMLLQVWENLISNAIKFSSKEPESHIRIEAREEAKEWVYSVHDNGCGFDEAFANKLFAVFQRLHKKRDYPGHGIGLANAARILHLHDGRIWGESKLGEGASFYFTLPK